APNTRTHLEIEVKPLVGAAPRGTPEKSAEEGTRRGEIVDGKREMEGLHSIPPSFERSDDRHAWFLALLMYGLRAAAAGYAGAIDAARPSAPSSGCTCTRCCSSSR